MCHTPHESHTTLGAAHFGESCVQGKDGWEGGREREERARRESAQDSFNSGATAKESLVKSELRGAEPVLCTFFRLDVDPGPDQPLPQQDLSMARTAPD